MRRLLNAILLIFLLLLHSGPVAAQPGVTILCYHHVGPYISIGKQANPYTVTPERLRAHFEYLRSNGYRVISLDDYIQYNQGLKVLPPKSVLLTFDDAYVSFYEKAYPLLKEYDYPAMLAVVGVWQEVPPNDPDRIMNWQQIKEMMASGLVEIASHSYNLHYRVLNNAFGDATHATSTFAFGPMGFETLNEFKQRIQQDLETSQALFEQQLGRKARALVWPYGEYNEFTLAAARDNGFELTFGLEGGANPRGEASLRTAKRGIIWGNPDVQAFAKFMSNYAANVSPVSAVQLDIDPLYDADKRQMQANLDLALSRVMHTQANTVYLQAFADLEGNGNVQNVYFKNSVAPVKVDVFSHVAQQFANRDLQVFAWIPTLSGQWLTKDHPDEIITAYDDKGKGWYTRATPFSPRVREQLKRMVRELAMHVPIQGVLFQDDLYMNDYEDFSVPAKTAFRNRFGMELTAEILQDPKIRQEWTKMKTNALTELTSELIHEIRQYRPNAQSARNIYAEAVLNPAAVEWFAQDFRQYLALYDYTVIMAYPYMEKQGDRTVAWLEQLATTALKDKTNAKKIVFKLQNYDWAKDQWVSRAELSRQVRALRNKGAVHIGYYPENLFSNQRDDSPF